MDHDANIVSVSQREFEQIYPKPCWVEHDPMEIWASQSSTLVEALAKADINSDQIAAIGITNQRETVVVWERETGKPIYNAIVWQLPPYRGDLRNNSSVTGWKSISARPQAWWWTRTSPAPR